MKFYSVHIWIWNDSMHVTICKDSAVKDKGFSFDINHIGGEPNWHRALETIAYFDSEFVYIAPRFGNADELTSEPKTKWQEYLDSQKIKDTGRYQSGYRVYANGTYREDFGSDR